KVLPIADKGNRFEAVFEAIAGATGDFVSLLDPDDSYEPEFLETLIRAHLSPTNVAAVAACEMGMYRVDGGLVARTYVGFRPQARLRNILNKCEARLSQT